MTSRVAATCGDQWKRHEGDRSWLQGYTLCQNNQILVQQSLSPHLQPVAPLQAAARRCLSPLNRHPELCGWREANADLPIDCLPPRMESQLGEPCECLLRPGPIAGTDLYDV
ncbi:hypothetical protein EYF80_026983 [Liparis tanakae]|uniref:Uncharacterized protein n=1 Tax=Liparis tanakae TaxID=230148 RepID=A0A4Z2HA34_9TELE|nr:hypothetical protein EYF80_026983 [Liparis tanakae]